MRIVLVKNKETGEVHPFKNLVKASELVKRSVQTLRDSFSKRGYFENKQFIITRETL